MSIVWVWTIVVVLVLLVFFYSVAPALWTRVFRLSSVFKGHTRPEVCLTFDDGPHPVYTPQLLDALDKGGVRATFFVLAEKAELHADIVERMIKSGHDIQIHGNTHLFVPLLGPVRTARQIQGAAMRLQKKFHVQTKWYRPTWGLCNLYSFVSLKKSGHRLVTWSIMVGDWKCTPVDILRQRIASRLHPGAIIVLHDNDETFGAELEAPKSVIELIPHLVQDVHAKGYRFATLAEWF
jgi:peptidoglycan/xylan/chitin deacetylase (PgdA/CDA1 family)